MNRSSCMSIFEVSCLDCGASFWILRGPEADDFVPIWCPRGYERIRQSKGCFAFLTSWQGQLLIVTPKRRVKGQNKQHCWVKQSWNCQLWRNGQEYGHSLSETVDTKSIILARWWKIQQLQSWIWLPQDKVPFKGGLRIWTNKNGILYSHSLGRNWCGLWGELMRRSLLDVRFE